MGALLNINIFKGQKEKNCQLQLNNYLLPLSQFGSKFTAVASLLVCLMSL